MRGGVGGDGGWAAEGYLSLAHRLYCSAFSKWQKQTQSTKYKVWDSHWQQFGTMYIIVIAVDEAKK